MRHKRLTDRAEWYLISEEQAESLKWFWRAKRTKINFWFKVKEFIFGYIPSNEEIFYKDCKYKCRSEYPIELTTLLNKKVVFSGNWNSYRWTFGSCK